eukprot:6749172-Alexandrium_andersonii.AAC.1
MWTVVITLSEAVAMSPCLGHLCEGPCAWRRDVGLCMRSISLHLRWGDIANAVARLRVCAGARPSRVFSPARVSGAEGAKGGSGT